MKKFLIFTAILFIGSNCILNAQIELRNPTQENKTILKNPTDNKVFNTNTVPFDEKVQDGPHMNLHKFGTEQKRNISVKQGDYNHYNQQSTYNQSITGTVDRATVNRPQSATLNNNQFNYNQNAGRKISNNTSSTNPTYNAPMQINMKQQNSELATTDNTTIQVSDRQSISINPNDGSSNTDTPIAPGGNPSTPIGDAYTLLVILAGLYAFILYRKQ